VARVLITGCSSGFGFDAAKTFQSRGDEVFAGLRSLEGSAVEDLRAAGATPVLIDVTDDISVERGVAQVLAGGAVDALVNNAGIVLRASVEESSDVLAHRVFETNFFGSLRMIRAVLPAMRARGAGVIVNISSAAGIAPLPGDGIYSATKFALWGLSEALHHETRQFDIRVRMVEPGNFPTTDIMAKALASARSFGSPYQPHLDAFATALSALRPAVSPDARLVVEAIWRAIHDPTTPFQQPVGADAEAVANARRALSFEGFEGLLHHALGWSPASPPR
jgi:NAD(P)-dependent dehydrogenase (short-subunit alcohol dehydrogenase family)